MTTINITCDTCHKIHELRRTDEIPAHVISMGCNWCPCCEDRATDYYEEWYNENDGDNIDAEIPVPDNQLCMPFLFDELGIKKVKEQPISA